MNSAGLRLVDLQDPGNFALVPWSSCPSQDSSPRLYYGVALRSGPHGCGENHLQPLLA